MQRQTAIALSAFLLALPSYGQITISTDTATAARPLPALLLSVTSGGQDSGLVRAAKQTVAARRLMKRGSTPLIDNNFVAHSRGAISGSTSSAGVAESPSSSPSAPRPNEEKDSRVANRDARASSGPSAQDLAAEAGRQKQLSQEQSRMRVENEQPYGDNVDEDLVTRRLTQIPGEMKTPPPSTPPR